MDRITFSLASTGADQALQDKLEEFFNKADTFRTMQPVIEAIYPEARHLAMHEKHSPLPVLEIPHACFHLQQFIDIIHASGDPKDLCEGIFAAEQFLQTHRKKGISSTVLQNIDYVSKAIHALAEESPYSPLKESILMAAAQATSTHFQTATRMRDESGHKGAQR